MRLTYLLDTNICIYIAKRKSLTLMKKFETLAVGEIGMSVITYGELLYGANKSQYFRQSHDKLIEMTTLIPILPLNNDVSEHYGNIRATLEKNGNLIGNNDLWIASHARMLDVILVTNNLKEFSRVENLKCENWI